MKEVMSEFRINELIYQSGRYRTARAAKNTIFCEKF